MSKASVQTERSDEIRNVVEAALMASEEPLSVRKLQNLFEEEGRPESKEIKAALKTLEDGCEGRGVELCQIGKGFRFQTRDRYSPWMRRMRDTRPPRYSRALLETLSIIAYRQPVTRGDIEGIRGVAVSSDIMRVLLDREWIGQVGHRDVPGRPALYATTSGFLEYFNLRSLSDLPTLLEPRDISEVAKELNITLPIEESDDSEGHEADVIGVDADGVPLDADDEDEEALSAEEDRRIEERRLAAEEEINESLAEIDEELAAVPKVTKKSIDKLMGIEDENAAEKSGDAKSVDDKADASTVEVESTAARSESVDRTDESSTVALETSADGVATERDDETDGVATGDAVDSDDVAEHAESESDETPVRLVSDESVTEAVTQSLAGVSAASLGIDAAADFDDDLGQVEALNPVVHNVGGSASDDDDESDNVYAADTVDPVADDSDSESGADQPEASGTDDQSGQV